MSNPKTSKVITISLIVIELPDEGAGSVWFMVLVFCLLKYLDGGEFGIVQYTALPAAGTCPSRVYLVLLKALTRASKPLFSILESIPQP
jgi:hypothetical protein